MAVPCKAIQGFGVFLKRRRKDPASDGRDFYFMMKKLSARIFVQAKLLDIIRKRDRTTIVDALGSLVQEPCSNGADDLTVLMDFIGGLSSLHDRLFVQPHIGCNELGEWGIGDMPAEYSWSDRWGAWTDAEGVPLPWKEEHPGEPWDPEGLSGVPDLDLA
jgi:hypothetical protein